MIGARGLLVSAIASAIVIACGGSTATSSGNAGGGSGGLTGQCAATECSGQTAPKHECVGGVPKTGCYPKDGEGCRLRIDCVPRDPSAPPDTRGVGSCPQGCGAEPTFDPADCLYGFAGKGPSCESMDGAPCAWSRRCLPKPCSPAEGTCNVLDRSVLGAPCGLEDNQRCPAGSDCASITVNIGEYIEPTCIKGDPCSALTCAAGASCIVLESYPAQVACARN